jgi:predicted  nucleic acid-binding Zn-ribbon protein
MVNQKSRAEIEAEISELEDEILVLNDERSKLDDDISELESLKKQWEDLIIRIKDDFNSSQYKRVSDILSRNSDFLDSEVPDRLSNLTHKLKDEDLEARKKLNALTQELNALEQF